MRSHESVPAKGATKKRDFNLFFEVGDDLIYFDSVSALKDKQ